MHLFCFSLFAAWMLPLHLPPWISWHKEILVFFGLISFAWVALFARVKHAHSRAHFSLSVSSFLPIGLILLTLAQYVLGQIVFTGDAVVLALYFGGALIALALGDNTYSKTHLANALAYTCVAAGLLSVGIALAQSFGIWGDSPFVAALFSYRRPGANLTQANQLATLLLFAWCSLVYLYLNSVLSRFTLLVGTLWLLFGVAVSESRTGLVSFVLLIGWALAHRKTVCKTLPFFVLMTGAMAYTTFLLSWPTLLQSFWMDLPRVGSIGINTAAGTRLDVWPQLWHAAMLKPWFGWGLLGVPAAHNAVLHLFDRAEPFSYAHNIGLDVVVDTGLPISILAFVCVVVWLYRRLSLPRTTITWYCFAVAVPLCTHSMTEYPFAYSFLLFPVLMLVGVAEPWAPALTRFSIPNWATAAFLTIFTVVSAYSAYEYIQIEEDFRVARFEALKVGQTPSDYHRPPIHLLTQLDAMLTATRTDPNTNMSQQQIDLLRLTTQRYPWTAIQNRYALSLALNGDKAEAIRQLKVMRAMHGSKAYAAITANWAELGRTKFPQLLDVELPN